MLWCICTDFNCVFDLKIDELLANPMCLSTIEQLQAQGNPNARQMVASSIATAAGERGFLKADGHVLFPQNVAVIAEAQLKI